jgi:hypothetical protein
MSRLNAGLVGTCATGLFTSLQTLFGCCSRALTIGASGVSLRPTINPCPAAGGAREGGVSRAAAVSTGSVATCSDAAPADSTRTFTCGRGMSGRTSTLTTPRGRPGAKCRGRTTPCVTGRRLRAAAKSLASTSMVDTDEWLATLTSGDAARRSTAAVARACAPGVGAAVLRSAAPTSGLRTTSSAAHGDTAASIGNSDAVSAVPAVTASELGWPCGGTSSEDCSAGAAVSAWSAIWA